MISNTELYFRKMKEFQDRRSQLMEQYEKDVQALQRFKGSQGYKEDREKLRAKHEADLTALIGEYRPGIYTVFGGMMDAIGKRSVSAPTNEQINLLNVLKMKKRVTFEECQRTAQAVKDNPIALSIVKEIAQDHNIGISIDDLGAEMSSERASDIVTGMKKKTDDFFRFDTTRASRLAEKYYKDVYGETAECHLTKRKPFEDKAGCFSMLAGVEGESLTRFTEIVDGGSEND